MNDLTRHSLVGAAVRSGFAVMEKSASATPEQREVMQAAWPSEDEGVTKIAQLSRIIAAGSLVEEADASVAAKAA